MRRLTTVAPSALRLTVILQLLGQSLSSFLLPGPQFPHRLCFLISHWLITHQHIPSPLGGSSVSPLAPQVGPYSAAPPHPSLFVLKGRASGPGMNSTQGILAMPSRPMERATCLFFI
uniref:Secreted protein n=1 Tax=Castor canadensis TaxID=51338 RepID=A0A8C0ZXF3_CASCN